MGIAIVSKRTRIAVDVSPRPRRRIKTAAHKADQSLREYIVSILEESVPDTEDEEDEKSGILSDETIARMDARRARTAQYGGPATEAAEDIRRMRDENLSVDPGS
jgi:hypothetical protein